MLRGPNSSEKKYKDTPIPPTKTKYSCYDCCVLLWTQMGGELLNLMNVKNYESNITRNKKRKNSLRLILSINLDVGRWRGFSTTGYSQITPSTMHVCRVSRNRVYREPTMEGLSLRAGLDRDIVTVYVVFSFSSFWMWGIWLKVRGYQFQQIYIIIL